jgi:hypothetical protein
MNEHATLLPFMEEKENCSPCNIPICVISNHLTHDTITVHAFLRHVLSHLKEINLFIKKGSSLLTEQPANKKKFPNLCCHEADFGLKAEWHFLHSVMAKALLMELAAH